jgi:hypothetical protein
MIQKNNKNKRKGISSIYTCRRPENVTEGMSGRGFGRFEIFPEGR